nr:hypothetical protein [Morchella crassipes]
MGSEGLPKRRGLRVEGGGEEGRNFFPGSPPSPPATIVPHRPLLIASVAGEDIRGRRGCSSPSLSPPSFQTWGSPPSNPRPTAEASKSPEPPWRPRRGPPWVLMGTPPAQQPPSCYAARGGRSPPSCIPPPLRGGRFPPPPFAGEGARSAPPQAKVKSSGPPFPSHFFLKNLRKSLSRGRRGGGDASLLLRRERRWWLGGGSPRKGGRGWGGGSPCCEKREGLKEREGGRCKQLPPSTLFLHPPPFIFLRKIKGGVHV